MNELKADSLRPRAMHTKRFVVVVGPQQHVFKVPHGLLVEYSPVLERMCFPSFLDSNPLIINLPEEHPSVFKDFFDWLHSSKPQVDFSKGTEAIFDLAIFAQKYQICHLMNQIADLIMTTTTLKKGGGEARLDPATLDHVYSSVPDGAAVLRQLCSWVLLWQVKNWKYDNSFQDFNQQYAEVFTWHPELGRDFFQWVSAKDANNVKPCQFHDHSNIPNAVKGRGGGQNDVCPYSDPS